MSYESYIPERIIWMNTCSNCRHENGEESAHCSKCGAKLLSSCNMCGKHLKSSDTHCSNCGTEVFLDEINLLRIFGIGIGGEFGDKVCAIGLSDKRLLIVSNKNGMVKYNTVPIYDVCKMKFKTSIVHAAKGSYAVSFMVASNKAKYRFVSNDGRKFAKTFSKALKASRKVTKRGQAAQKNHPGFASKGANQLQKAPEKDPSRLDFTLGVACLLLPLVGIVVWLGERKKYPSKAKNALLLGIVSLSVIAITSSRSRSNYLNRNSELITETIEELSYVCTVIDEDIYDVPIKTQVERNIVITGEISHEQMDELLIVQYEAVIASTGYEFRDHPDAVYLYYYASGRSGLDWIGRIEKHAASNSPCIYNRIPEGETIHISSHSSSEQTVVAQSAETIYSRFEKNGVIITDSSTGLQWRLGPDTNTSFNDAVDWINLLDSDWRMPTINELSALYQAGIVNDDDGLIWCDIFFNTGCWVWSSDRSDNTSAKVVYFWGGDVLDFSTTSNRNSNFDGRVFAVR